MTKEATDIMMAVHIQANHVSIDLESTSLLKHHQDWLVDLEAEERKTVLVAGCYSMTELLLKMSIIHNQENKIPLETSHEEWQGYFVGLPNYAAKVVGAAVAVAETVLRGGWCLSRYREASKLNVSAFGF
ncbi:hypothetical protein SADUNF_Sadunf11G0033600 [Salix dunnii]|uniref:Uncharacterized protein n=1 Tax=Salix dunnii TaxID=1413687 RepID=A0A835JNE2_9ROSI|nr:hypothetical protein SADUNF_Sadunf11G0033600 [Salix dunnii]